MMRVINAYDFYLRCVFKNRVRSLGTKLKSPRYIIGLVLAVVYVWFFFYRSFSNAAAGELSRRESLGRIGMTFYYALNLGGAWVLGTFGRGVVFRQQEIQQLFAAPLLRAHLLLFKFFQAQGPLIITALVFTALSYRFSPKPFWLLVPSLYLAGVVAHVHGILVVLTLKRIRSAGGAVGLLGFLPGLLLLAAIVFGAWQGVQQTGLPASVNDLMAVMNGPVLSVVLQPAMLLSDYVLHDAGSAFLIGSGVLLAVAGVLAGLIVLADHRFEDQAVSIATMIDGLKKDGLSALQKKDKFVLKQSKRSFPVLAPRGPVWRAIVWKNITSIGRLQKKTFRILFFVLMMVAFMASTFDDDVGSAKVRTVIGFVALGIAAYASLLGPALLRVDLRIDIPHFDVLKAMPIRGRDLLVGEVMGPALFISAAQSALAIVGALALPADAGRIEVTAGLRACIVASAVPGFFAIGVAFFTLENLLALYLPSFARLGRGMKSGFDQFGQNLMGAIVRALAVVIMLIPAGIVGALTVFLLSSFTSLSLVAVIPLTVLLCGMTICGECLLMLTMSEERYETFDLSAESLTVES